MYIKGLCSATDQIVTVMRGEGFLEKGSLINFNCSKGWTYNGAGGFVERL